MRLEAKEQVNKILSYFLLALVGTVIGMLYLPLLLKTAAIPARYALYITNFLVQMAFYYSCYITYQKVQAVIYWDTVYDDEEVDYNKYLWHCRSGYLGVALCISYYFSAALSISVLYSLVTGAVAAIITLYTGTLAAIIYDFIKYRS